MGPLGKNWAVRRISRRRSASTDHRGLALAPTAFQLPTFTVEAPLVLFQAPALLVQLLLANQIILYLSLLPLPLQVLLLAL